MFSKTCLELIAHEELIELVLQLQAEAIELRSEVAKLKARVVELEARLASKNRPPKTSSNSSISPSSDRKVDNPPPPRSWKRKKKGAKLGHVGKSRLRSEPDVFIECKLNACPDCGADLQNVEQKAVGRSQVVEIPPVQPLASSFSMSR